MAWDDNRSEPFADQLHDAGNALMLAAAIAGAVGLFGGFTPLLIGAAVAGFAGMAVPPVYGLLKGIARNVLASQPDDTLTSPEQPQANLGMVRREDGCESARHQELEALRQKAAARYRSL